MRASRAVVALTAAVTIAAISVLASGCSCSQRLGGALAPKPKLDPAKAPASRLRPERITVGLGGSGVPDARRVTNVFASAWSPDGKRIAVVGGRSDDLQPGLWVGTPGAGAPKQLLPRATGAVFSPDSSRLAVTTLLPNGSLAVGVMPADGGKLTLVAGQAVAPAWSPDGSRIAYLTAKDIEAQTFDLAVAAAPAGAGASAGETTAAPAPATILARSVAGVAPVWGPTGQALVYFVDGKTGQLSSVAVPPPSTRTTPPAKAVTALKNRVDDVSIDAAGGRLAFLEVSQPSTPGSTGPSEPAWGHARVYSISTGALSAPLGERLVSHPMLSADGRRLWAAADGGELVADTVGTALGFVPVGRQRAYTPNPSPDGRSVTVVSPTSDVAAVILLVDLGVFESGQTRLVVTDVLEATSDPEPALDKLFALQPTSLDTTQEVFQPGYPVAFSSDALAGLPARKLVVAAGRFDTEPDAAALLARLKKAGLRPRLVVVE